MKFLQLQVKGDLVGSIIVRNSVASPLSNTIGQGCAAAKPLAALAGKVRLAMAGKFPIIPKGYSGLVQQLLVIPSHWWNYGEVRHEGYTGGGLLVPQFG